jgi:hypothetical protein
MDLIMGEARGGNDTPPMLFAVLSVHPHSGFIVMGDWLLSQRVLKKSKRNVYRNLRIILSEEYNEHPRRIEID